MSDQRPASPASAPVLSSPVTNEPLGRLVVCSLLVGFTLLALPLGIALWSYWKLASGLLLVLAVGALPLAWRTATRDTAWRLLTLSPQALRLAPLSGAPATAAETIPLTSLVAYQLWLDRDRVFTRYYLRLELAGGRVLRLADPPGALPNDPPGSVPLNELAAQLARWVGPDTIVRLPFWQTPLARWLRLLSWLAVGTVPFLFWGGYVPTGVIVLAFAVGYLFSYYLVRRLAGRDARP
ncbi:hypothetical protein A0257_17280 [Hymenobacter psoromatis]|nr:hypothetical protein A0257_17280 [Hymenobacter psoromatis]